MLIDLHSHVLPGIDDGAESMEEARETLRTARAQGFDAIVLTPHFYPEGDGVTREQVMDGMRQLEPEAARLGLRLYPGMECFYHTKLPALLEAGEALTLAGGRYTLVEFAEDVSLKELRYGLKSVAECGCVPILAHYERYRCLMNRKVLRELTREGALLQMNFDTIQRTYGLFGRNPFLSHIREGMVSFMGSDTHGTHYRPMRTGPSVEWLRRYGYLEKMNDNAGRVLRDEY